MSKLAGGRKVIYQCIEKLAHAKQCGNPYCTILGCIDMKKHVDHYKQCCVGTKGGCGACVQLEGICVYHTRTCRNKSCGVPFCSTIKEKARMSQVSGETQRKSGSVHRRIASFSGTSQQPPEYQPHPRYGRSGSSSRFELATPIDVISIGLTSNVSMKTVALENSMPCNVVNTWGPDQRVISPPSIPSSTFSAAVSQEHDNFLREVLGFDDDAKELQNSGLDTERDVFRSVESPHQECEVQFFDEAFNHSLLSTSGDPLFSTEPICQMETAPHSDQVPMDVLDATHSGQVSMDVLDAATTCKSSESQDLSPPSTLKCIIQFLQKIEENPVLRDAFEKDYMKSTGKNSDLGGESAQVRAGSREIVMTQPDFPRSMPETFVWGELESPLQSTEDRNCGNLRRTQSLPSGRQKFPCKDNNVLIQTYLVDPFLQL